MSIFKLKYFVTQVTLLVLKIVLRSLCERYLQNTFEIVQLSA